MDKRRSIRIEIRVDFPLLNLNSMKAMQLDRPIVLFVMGDEPTPEGVGRHRPPPTVTL